MEETVGKGWKTATYVLGAAVVAQFVWWDKKCPQVFGSGKGYSGMQGLRSANSPASHKVTTQYRAAATRKNVARAVARGNERAADAARDRARAEFNRLYAAAATNAEAKTVEKAYRWLRK